MIVIGIFLFIWHITEGKVQHHFHDEPENMLCDFSSEEQAEILDAFGITFPDNEENAYVYSFSYRYGINADGPDPRVVSYAVEIGGVADYEAFYAANSQLKSFNETTKNFRTDRHYYIVYRNSVDTHMEPDLYSRFSRLYDRLSSR